MSPCTKYLTFDLRKLKAWEAEKQIIDQNVVGYITNPLNAYVMIKRATSDIKLIKERFSERANNFMKKLDQRLPTSDDLTGAVEGLLRLQSIYKLKSNDFSNGIIDGKQTREPLSLHDVFVIGEEATSLSNQNYFAIEYLEMVWNKVNFGLDTDNEVNETVLLHHLASCYNTTGHFNQAIHYIDILLDKYPEYPEFRMFKEYLIANVKFGMSKVSLVDPFLEDYTKDGQFHYFKEDILYSQMCRRALTKSPTELATLHCRYVSNNPFTKLARFKVEEFHLEPYIVLFVDVLSKAETNFLTTQSRTRVQRAQVEPNGLTKATSNRRVAQNSWHYDTEHEILAKISRRVEVS